MNFPPTKRLRGQDVVSAMPFDPFGDDDDFTQDDLDEIDIITSQAITSTALPEHGVRSSSPTPTTVGPSRCVKRAANEQSRENRMDAGIPRREPLGKRQQQFGSDRNSYTQLEAQHAELKRKLKEVEEEILLKSGEIRVLRDSLKAAQQEKDAQRNIQILHETEKQREHSEREKELNRKVQSLQSELQFKEAEINEMKSKLVNSDKNKTASPLPRNSPKVLSSLVQSRHGSGSSSPSPAGNGFITKETFGANIPAKTTPGKTRRDAGLSSSSRNSERQESSRPDPFLSVRPAHPQHRGGVLLGLLLQQPLSPSSLGLSHLLSVSPSDVPPTSCGRSDSNAAVSVSGGAGGAPRAAQTPVQSLAVTGLNMLSQSGPEPAAGSRNQRSCPGAVLLLPLLKLHLSRLCLFLDSLRLSSSGGGASASGVCAAAGKGRGEEPGVCGFSAEDAGLAALRLLPLLLSHSDEVVEAVLSESQSADADRQNAVLPSVLRLCEAGTGAAAAQNEELALNAMTTLRVVIERTKDTHTDRLRCVLPVVCVCLSADRRLHTVSECVSVLTSMSDHDALAKQLSAQHDPCVFLKLFQFIRNRPDNQASRRDWIQLDLQVVRLLSRLTTQGAQLWSSSPHSSCSCYTEVVQTAVVVFHRQWLDLCGSQEETNCAGPAPPWPRHGPAPSSSWCCSPAASLLRECLMLLHWLLQHHRSFSESCRPLLHMYDQVIPAVRDTLRKIPELSESEELALEEICRSDGDEADDMDIDTAS